MIDSQQYPTSGYGSWAQWKERSTRTWAEGKRVLLSITKCPVSGRSDKCTCGGCVLLVEEWYRRHGYERGIEDVISIDECGRTLAARADAPS